jgi:hypothetical protein
VNQAREKTTGRYAFDGRFDRACVCGHTLGVHIAGGFECINHDVGDGKRCDCLRFREKRRR